jgi:outer membrane protein assembly factor BamB
MTISSRRRVPARDRGAHSPRRRSPRHVTLACGLAALAILGFAAPAIPADWPHWRGPRHDGTSPDRGLPVEWGSDRNVRWKLALPAVSGATPIVASDLVFLSVGDGERLELWAVGAAGGEVRWKRSLGEGNQVTRKQNMSSPSPVTDGERVWVLTGTGVVKAFDLAGRELWRRALQDDYGRFGLNWGYASSPLLVDGVLVVQVLHGMDTDDPSYVVAIDARSGETRWRVERPTDARVESPDAYTTPLLLTAQGRRELVVSGGDYVTGHDLATGKELWRVAGLNPGREANYRLVASPLAVGEWLYVPSRVAPLLALRVPRAGAPEVVWKTDRGTDVPSPVADGERLYVVNDRGILRRFAAATGAEIGEPMRLAQGTYSASPVLADGRLYAVNETGVTTVVAIADEPRILAENALAGYTLASPAISGGRIYLRTAEYLYCIEAAPAR